MNFYDAFFALPVSQRQLIADGSGMSLPYILKQTYVKQRSPVFRFVNAVALDKASGGALPFTAFSEHADQIDWEYVAKRLASARRNGTLPTKGKQKDTSVD